MNELNNRNPTVLLVSAIEKISLSGTEANDDEFYLGMLRDGDLWQVHRIMSGSPSRGTMALETETAPGEGTSVQVSPPLSASTSQPKFVYSLNSYSIVQVMPWLRQRHLALRRMLSLSWLCRHVRQLLADKGKTRSRFWKPGFWRQVRMDSC